MSDAQVFLFADLAGITALTEAHGDERGAELIDKLTRITCGASVGAPG